MAAELQGAEALLSVAVMVAMRWQLEWWGSSSSPSDLEVAEARLPQPGVFGTVGRLCTDKVAHNLILVASAVCLYGRGFAVLYLHSFQYDMWPKMNAAMT